MPADDDQAAMFAAAAQAARDAQRNVQMNRTDLRITYLTVLAGFVTLVLGLIDGLTGVAIVGGVFTLISIVRLVGLYRARTKTFDRIGDLITHGIFAIVAVSMLVLLIYTAVNGVIGLVVFCAVFLVCILGGWIAVARIQKLSNRDPR